MHMHLAVNLTSMAAMWYTEDLFAIDLLAHLGFKRMQFSQ